MQAKPCRPRSGIRKKGNRGCCHGTCKTNDYKEALNGDVFFLNFPKPCAIHRNNEIARILSRHDDVVAHVESECRQCSKALRWVSLCKRHEPKAKRLLHITKNLVICSKHFINPHPIHGPSEEHPDPFNANLSEEKIQKLKNSKRKKPSDRSAVVVTKKTRKVRNTSKDTLPCLHEDADSPIQPHKINSDEASKIWSMSVQQHDDAGACNVENVSSTNNISDSTSKCLPNPAREGPSCSQNVNNIEVSKSSVNCSQIPLVVLERLRCPSSGNDNFELRNSASESLLIPAQEGLSNQPKVNIINNISYSTAKSLLVPAPREECIPQNVNNNVENGNSTIQTGLLTDVQEGVSYPLNLNSTEENSNLRSEIVVIPVPDVDNEPRDAQHVNNINEIRNSTSRRLFIPVRLRNLPNVNISNNISHSTAKSLLIPAQREECISQNARSRFGNNLENVMIDVQEGVSYPLNLNNANEISKLWSATLLPDGDDDSLANAQHEVDDIFSNANYGSVLPETNHNLEALMTKYGKLKWFTNFEGETASFLKLSKDNLPLFIIKVTENIGEANFSYELFMFNQIFPIETAELDRLDEVEARLRQMGSANVCRGITCEELKKFFLQRQMLTGASVCAITGGLRSQKCHLFSDNNNTTCESCRNYGYRLRYMLKKGEKQGITEPNKFTSHKSMSEKWLRKKLAASATMVKEAKKKLATCEKRIERLTKEKKELQNNNNINNDFASIFFEDSD